MDVADEASVAAVVAAATARLGPPDLVVACAGIVVPGCFDAQPPSAFRRSMEVNYLGALHLVRAALSVMRPRGGRIVLVASGAALIGLYGYTSACKWITEIELTTFDAYDVYWVERGWAQVAPIKTMARIDTPQGLGNVQAGPAVIGGVAWAIHRGISGVEVRIDGGPWQPARLGEVPSVDTWRQWAFDWEATSGRHTIEARAVDGAGEVQTDQRAEPIPDGASGWHQVVVIVS